MSLTDALAKTLRSRLAVMLPRSRATSLLKLTSRAPLSTETVPPKRLSAPPAMLLPSNTSLPLATPISLLPATFRLAAPLLCDSVPPSTKIKLPLNVTSPSDRALLSLRLRLRALTTLTEPPRVLPLSSTMSLLPASRLKLPPISRAPLSDNNPAEVTLRLPLMLEAPRFSALRSLRLTWLPLTMVSAPTKSLRDSVPFMLSNVMLWPLWVVIEVLPLTVRSALAACVRAPPRRKARSPPRALPPSTRPLESVKLRWRALLTTNVPRLLPAWSSVASAPPRLKVVMPETVSAPVSVRAPPAVMFRSAAKVAPRLKAEPVFSARVPATVADKLRLLASVRLALPAVRLKVPVKSLRTLSRVTACALALTVVVPEICTAPVSLTAPPALSTKLPATFSRSAAPLASSTAPPAVTPRSPPAVVCPRLMAPPEMLALPVARSPASRITLPAPAAMTKVPPTAVAPLSVMSPAALRLKLPATLTPARFTPLRSVIKALCAWAMASPLKLLPVPPRLMACVAVSVVRPATTTAPPVAKVMLPPPMTVRLPVMFRWPRTMSSMSLMITLRALMLTAPTNWWSAVRTTSWPAASICVQPCTSQPSLLRTP